MLALSAMTSLPVRVPFADGLNLTVMLQELPAVNVAPQVFAVMEKSPLPAIAMLVI